MKKILTHRDFEVSDEQRKFISEWSYSALFTALIYGFFAIGFGLIFNGDPWPFALLKGLFSMPLVLSTHIIGLFWGASMGQTWLRRQLGRGMESISFASLVLLFQLHPDRTAVYFLITFGLMAVGWFCASAALGRRLTA
ncbi:MAG: hypothetical protein ACPGGK_02225 [Pikeienuella sp.]